MKTWALFILVFLSSASFGQRINQLWLNKNYEDIYEQRNRVNRMSSGDMLRVAQSAFILEHDSEALYIVDLAIEKNYADERHYFLQGEVLRAQGFYLSAAESFHQALALRPQRLTYMMAKADAYYRGRQNDSALAVFSRVHDLFPDKDVATFMECKIQAEEGYIRPAMECWKLHIMELVDREYKARAREELMNLAWHMGNDTAEAIRQINALIRMQPEVIKHRISAIQMGAEQRDWELVESQRNYILERFEEGSLPGYYASKNAYPLMDLLGDNYRLQYFETLRIQEQNGVFAAKWFCFLATPIQGVKEAEFIYIEDADGIRIEGTSEGFVTMILEEPLSLQEFHVMMKAIEANL